MINILIIDDNAVKANQVKEAIIAGYNIPVDMIDMATCQSEGREKMTEKAYDVVVLDLVLPFGKGEDPEPDGGIKFLKLLEQNSTLKLPLQVIGLTQYEDEYERRKEDFNNFLFQLVLRKQGDSCWRDDVLRAIGFISRAKQSMYDTITRRDKYDILILCALREEFNELLSAFGGKEKWIKVKVVENLYNAYEMIIESAAMKQYRVLAFCINQSGMVATSVMTSYLTKWCAPKCVFMTGITGGISRDGIKRGDVIIAESVQDYAVGKIVEYKDEIKLLHEIHQLPVNPKLLSQISEYVSDEASVAKMNVSIRKMHLQQNEEEYKVYSGPTICGPFVMASEKVVEQLKAESRKISAIDMEGFGLMTTSYLLNIPAVWIKGVSDMANMQKDDIYHTLAAYASGALLYGFIKEGLDV